MARQPTAKTIADEWNEANPSGTAVSVRTPTAGPNPTTTRGSAWVQHGVAVVLLEGHRGARPLHSLTTTRRRVPAAAGAGR